LKYFSIISAILFLCVSFASVAETGSAAIIYNGVNSVNKEALHYIRQEASRVDDKYTFDPISVSSEINMNDYKVFIVLNSGMESGIDPDLAGFISSVEDKSSIILLTLVKNSTDFVVKTFDASEETGGVDAISAASLWKHSGLFKSNKDLKEMHNQWLFLLLREIDRKSEIR
jgi:hypothetical protein